MQYLLIVFVLMMVIIGLISHAVQKKAKQAQDDANTNKSSANKAKKANKKSTARSNTQSGAHQPIQSQLNTNYASRLEDTYADGLGTYDTVDDISDEDVTTDSSTQGNSIIDYSILYGDQDDGIDSSSIATVMVLGEILGKPKSKR